MFIHALYELAENCDFGAQKTEHIRDKLVVGIRDNGLSRRMQLMTDLTLDMAVLMVRQEGEPTRGRHTKQFSGGYTQMT